MFLFEMNVVYAGKKKKQLGQTKSSENENNQHRELKLLVSCN